MGRWDSKERRDSNRETFNQKVGKIMVISAIVGLGFYLAYIIPEFLPNSSAFVK